MITSAPKKVFLAVPLTWMKIHMLEIFIIFCTPLFVLQFLYSLWKTWAHLSRLRWECLQVWRLCRNPELLVGRSHQWVLCNPTEWLSLWGPWRSLGTPSISNMANSTTSKHMTRMATSVEAAQSRGVHFITQVGCSRVIINSSWPCSKTPTGTEMLPKVPPWAPSDTLTPAVLDSLLKPVTMFPPECNWILMRAKLCNNMLKFTPLATALTQ